MLVFGLTACAGDQAAEAASLYLCDVSPRGVCVVTFGSASPDRMLIHLRRPDPLSGLFAVRGIHRGVTFEYACAARDERSLDVYCEGPRTPLGEYLDLEVYSPVDDTLLAQGRLLVSAVMVWTPAPLPTTAASRDDRPVLPTSSFYETPTPLDTGLELPTPSLFETPTPLTGYPNP